MSLILANCSSVAMRPSAIPEALSSTTQQNNKQQLAPTDSLTSNGGTLRSFSDARFLQLKTDADFGRFIDAQVQGVDRQVAISLLRLMPSGMRGDFVYIRKDGTILSNRLVLRSMAKRVHWAPLGRTALKPQNVRIPMMYPPTGGSGGAYIREYSQQGVNAAYGYATLPCDGTFTQAGESGNMYFNAYSATSSGSVVDAGITVNSTANVAPGYTQAQTAAPFVFAPGYGGWDPGTWVNESQTWGCGIPLGIMYGTYQPNSASSPISLLAVGVPNYDPRQSQLPPSSAQWFNSAWTFFQTPSPLVDYAHGSWNGIPSPCLGCSVARMFSIGQQTSGTNYDGSCFGACNTSAVIGEWDQVVVGELVNPCGDSSGSATCTIQFASNGAWISGENDSSYGIYRGDQNDQQALQGINLGANLAGDHLVATSGKFRDPLLPVPPTACTPDSHGYCAVLMKYSAGSCHSTASLWTYEIFKAGTRFSNGTMVEYQSTATKSETTNGKYCDLVTDSWLPADPAVTYNDPSLP